MTTSQDKKIFADLINNNPGNVRIFKCCKRVYRTNKEVPPVILCPECGNSVICDMTNSIKDA